MHRIKKKSMFCSNFYWNN